MKNFTEEERYNYDLNHRSVVVDAGAYHGHFARKIWEKYKCNVWAYEPTKKFRDVAFETLRGTDVYLFPFGLSDKNETLKFGIANDSTGKFKESEEVENVVLMDANQILQSLGVIDLLKLNIEGGEYGVLSRLIETCSVSKIKNIQIQFHRCVPNSDMLVSNISSDLLKTHHLTYDAGAYIWQNWEINQ